MMKIAVLITVFNRRETTLIGLRSLYAAIEKLGKDYSFDVYLTNDGCSDGTADAVRNSFPKVIIVEGNGSLFWGGGMNLAWRTAVDSKVGYDYYLWYNDDSNIFPDALKTMFNTITNAVVVTGAFKGHDGNVSYGGQTKDEHLIQPNGQSQDVVKMNGNLVLIPDGIFQQVGFIDNHFLHGGGDFDYGFKVREKGYKVVLTPQYVGVADRHDAFIPKYCNKDIPLSKRWRILHNPMNSPKIHFQYSVKREGIIKAIAYFIIGYVGVLFPSLYVKVKTTVKKK